MENLPEVQPDQPLVPSSEGKRELVVVGDEVYLPQSESFAPDDAKFADTVAEALPEYAASLSDEALRRPRGYSAGAILLILLFLGALVIFLFVLRPLVRLEITSGKVPEPKIMEYGGEFSPEFKKAKDHTKAERYKDAQRILRPVVDALLARGEAGPRNEPIFYAYFDLCERLGWDGEAERLNRLIELDDQYRWEFFDLRRQLAAAGGEDMNQLPDTVTPSSLYRAMDKIDALKKRFKDKPELTRWLDLHKCHFDLKLWRLKNRPKPDDERGLLDREEAWQIASRYPKDATFIELRLKLVKQMLDDGTSFSYRFKGKRVWSEKHLRAERQNLEILLEKAKKEKAAGN